MTTEPTTDAMPPKCNTHKNCRMQDGEQDYAHGCTVCGAKPTVHPTDLCGPCCFGEGETANGNW
jgi:hypothetical protein